jgi:hypothetical protein
VEPGTIKAVEEYLQEKRNMTHSKEINRTQLKQCNFIKSPFSFKNSEQREINRHLHLNMLLSSKDKGKVRIVFNTADGYREISTSIWGTTKKLILLNEGAAIPVESVTSIRLE